MCSHEEIAHRGKDNLIDDLIFIFVLLKEYAGLLEVMQYTTLDIYCGKTTCFLKGRFDCFFF